MNYLKKYIFPLFIKLSTNDYLVAIRDGMVLILPIIIIGSFFLLLGQLPVNLNNFKHIYIISLYLRYNNLFLFMYKATMGLVSVYASISIVYSYFIKKDIENVLMPVILNLSVFLFLVLNQKGGIDFKTLGGKGLFLALFSSLFTIVLFYKLTNFKLKFNFKDVPQSVIDAFNTILPSAIILFIVWFIKLIFILFNTTPVKVFYLLFKPLERLGDSLIAVIIVNLVLHLIWLAGIHGASVVNAVFLALWLSYLDQNAFAVAHHKIAPYITAQPFYQWFVWIGGSGATLSLVFLLFYKKGFLKDLAKLSILPSVFNINEPIIFGIPIVLNFKLALPFILAPIVNGVISYFVFYFNLIQRPYILVPWTLPAPIGAFLSTGGDFKAFILVLLLIIIDFLIYLPFIIRYEKV